MNNAIDNALKTLREQGHAVITFTPEELGPVAPCDLEDSLVSYANTHLLPMDEDEDEDEEEE